MKKKLIMLCTAIIALVLELLPYGAVCNFANPEGEPWRYTYSYFDLTPFGYANFAPFIVALLTCVLTVMIVVSLVSKKPMRTPVLTVSAVATVAEKTNIDSSALLHIAEFLPIVTSSLTVMKHSQRITPMPLQKIQNGVLQGYTLMRVLPELKQISAPIFKK